jgi:chemotaxis response regulator CheB
MIRPDVITVFLRSLTQYWKEKLIAVIVSGYDGDGATAQCVIKEIGGVTIAQKPDFTVKTASVQTKIVEISFAFAYRFFAASRNINASKIEAISLYFT